MSFRINKTVAFETEVLFMNSLIPMAAASLCCLLYFAITSTLPDMWVMGLTFNMCWIMSLRETILTCYLQGVSDTVGQSPYLKPGVGDNRTFSQKTAPEDPVN